MTQAQFFANAVNTSISGMDLVASYGSGLGDGGAALSAAASLSGTNVEEVNIPEELIAAFEEADRRAPNDAEREVIRSTLFNREERNRIEDALPRTKFNLSVRYNLNHVGILAAATYYGSVEYKPTNEDHDEILG